MLHLPCSRHRLPCPASCARQAEAAAAAAKVQLPADMLETARAVGLRSSAFSKYVALQGLGLSAALARRFPAVRDRLIADDKFMFKVVAEILIDSGEARARGGTSNKQQALGQGPDAVLLAPAVKPAGRRSRPRQQSSMLRPRRPTPCRARFPHPAVCATVAEVRKRGDEFWAEFEFYLSVRGLRATACAPRCRCFGSAYITLLLPLPLPLPLLLGAAWWGCHHQHLTLPAPPPGSHRRRGAGRGAGVAHRAARHPGQQAHGGQGRT